MCQHPLKSWDASGITCSADANATEVWLRGTAHWRGSSHPDGVSSGRRVPEGAVIWLHVPRPTR